MSWQGIEGHDGQVEQFRRALARGRLASSFLFVGPEGVGKRMFALKLAQSLLCGERPDESLDPCGHCPACAQVRAETHPDLLQVAKPGEKAFLPVELLIGDQEHRMRQGLCHDIGMKPFMGGRRIAVIDDADYLNAEGANCLLKTLEEPPPRSLLILIGTSPARQLPTIRSRCQLVRFDGLPDEVVAALVLERGMVDDPKRARRLAAYSRGSMARATAVADEELWAFREHLLQHLAGSRLDCPALEAEIGSTCDSAGRHAAARRNRLHQVAEFAVEFYGELLQGFLGGEVGGDDLLRAAVATRLRRGMPSQEAIEARIEACVDFEEQIDRNANQTTLIHAWVNRLA